MDSESILRKKDLLKTKRKSAYYFLDNLDRGWKYYLYKNPSNWKCKSYNMGKRKEAFVAWAFSKYKLPRFLLKSLEDYLYNSGCELFAEWAHIVGIGKSFHKETKDIFTKKEAHLFLNAPENNTVEKNIIWSKCVTRGIKVPLMRQMLKVNNNVMHNIPAIEKICDFVKLHENEISNDFVLNFSDFILNNKDFELSKRTVKSVTACINKWHREIYILGKDHQKIDWCLVFDNWIYEVKDKNDLVFEVWTVREISNSNALFDEGDAMNHCVYSYLDRCESGESHILSLRLEAKRVATIEVRDNVITQARKKNNRNLSSHEMHILEKWAGNHGINISESYL